MEHDSPPILMLGVGWGLGSDFLAVQELDYNWVRVYSTTVKAHIKLPQAKKSTACTECLGRSRGGFGTKVHTVVDELGNCLHLALTLADSPKLTALLATLETGRSRVRQGL